MFFKVRQNAFPRSCAGLRAQDPRCEAYDAPPGPVVNWGKPPSPYSTPLGASRLRPSELEALPLKYRV